MNYPIKIVGCVVDVHNLTMYKADGDTIVIPQGDPRVKDLVAKLVPAMDSRKPQPERFYVLQVEDMQDKNHFAEAEKKMSGTVRFFKMLKSKAKELIEKFIEPVEPMELGDKREAVKVPPTPVHVINGVVQEQEAPALNTEPAKPKPAAPALKDIPKVKKAAPAKPAVPKRKAELTQLAAVQPKAVKMTQVEGMAKLVEIYNRNPDKQNAKEIVAFKQKAKKSWDVLGVTDAKFIKKITERAKL